VGAVLSRLTTTDFGIVPERVRGVYPPFVTLPVKGPEPMPEIVNPPLLSVRAVWVIFEKRRASLALLQFSEALLGLLECKPGHFGFTGLKFLLPLRRRSVHSYS
jgi:hypothetical protein